MNMPETDCASAPNERRMRRGVRRVVRGPFLALLAACIGLSTPGRAETMKIGGTGAALGTIRILAEAFQATHADLSIEVPASVGSGGGVNGTVQGIFALGVTSRPLKDGEREMGVRQIRFAKTALVLVTRDGYGKDGLSSRELVEIFAGKRTVWADGTVIRIILRPERDSDTTLLGEYIPGMASALAAAHALPGIPVAYTDQEAMDYAEGIAGALTTATLAAIRSENRRLVPIPVDDVVPTIGNVASGSYPMSETLYFVTGPEVSPLAREFIRFVQSAEGAAILGANGLLALSAESG